MAHVSLYRKYRPDSFAEVVGQDHVTETLARAVDGQSWHHAYLFCGPRGTGKTSSARLLAMGLNASNGPTSSPDPNDPIVVAIREGSCPDVIEIDAASNSGVDDVRDLRDKIAYSPTQGRLRIYIVDECHMLSNSAWNAFLKTIEEPPGHVVFIFATTEPHKVLPTVLSRTQRFDFRRVSDQVLTDHCKRICAAESVSITDEALAPIVRAGDGSVRDTLSVLDQVIAFTGNTIDAEAVNRVLSTVPSDLLDQLVNAIARADVADAFGLVGQVAEQGIDLRQFALDAQNHLRELLILNAAPEAGLIEGTPERLAELKASAASTDTDRLLFAVETLNDAQVRMRAGNTRLPLEVALAKAVLYGADRARDIPRLAPKPVTQAEPQPAAQPSPQGAAQSATQAAPQPGQAAASQPPAQVAPQPTAQAEPQAEVAPQAPTASVPASAAPAVTAHDAAAEPVRVPAAQPTPQQPVAQAAPVAQAEPAAAQVAPLADSAPMPEPAPAPHPSGAGSQHGAFEPEADIGNQAALAEPQAAVAPPAVHGGHHGAFEPEADSSQQVATPTAPAPTTQPTQSAVHHGVFEPEADLGDQVGVAGPEQQVGGQHGAFEPEVDLHAQPPVSPEGQAAHAMAPQPGEAPGVEAALGEDSLPPEPEQVESLFDDMPELEPEAVMPPASQAPEPEPTPAPATEPAAPVPAPAQPAAQPTQDTPASTLTLADATAAWNRVLTQIMGESKRIWSTYSQGEPSQVNGNTVVIGFRFPFHANMAAEPDAIAVASRHFTTVLGTKVKVATETNAQAEPIAPPQPAEEPVEQFEPEVEDTRAPIDPVDEDQQFRDAVALVKSELGATDTE